MDLSSPTNGVLWLKVNLQLFLVIFSALNSIPDPCKNDVICALTACLRKEIAVEDTEDFRRVVDNIASCMENNLGNAHFTVWY